MRELTYLGNSKVGFRDSPDPSGPRPDEALVRPLAVARCDLDRPMVMRDLFPGPFPVGHETVAEVLQVGETVTGFSAGDRVLVPFQVSCGTCRECSGRRYAACARHRRRAGAMFGFGAAGGGHPGAVSDTMLVPAADHMLLLAPRLLSSAALATLSDNVVDAYRAVAPSLQTTPDLPVLVLGGGLESIALYAVAIAVALGSSDVRYVDTDPERCRLAADLGADSEQISSWPRRFGSAPLTVDGSGDPTGLLCALRSTEAYGTCISVSIYFDDPPLPLLEMYTRGVTLHTSRADSRRYLPEVLALVESGRFDPLSVSTTTVGWQDAEAAWLEPATKLVIVR